MDDILKQYIATFLRNLATPLIVWAAASGWVTSDQATAFVVAGVSIAISLIWGFVNKFIARKKTEKALALPAGSSWERLSE